MLHCCVPYYDGEAKEVKHIMKLSTLYWQIFEFIYVTKGRYAFCRVPRHLTTHGPLMEFQHGNARLNNCDNQNLRDLLITQC